MIENLRPGAVVVIRAFDDVPEHRFRVDSIHEDCVTGTAVTGPLAGHYGEPSIELIVRVVDPA
ncbi:MAG: hypothetical protein ABJH07_19970 [Sedimentitalea sp.]|uniref:hypothetical protein n=1 Tax=Sedimentitalea sp. TaxID=2048915 RepID=UPI00329787E4